MGQIKNIKLHIVTDIKKAMSTIISQIERCEGQISDIQLRLDDIDLSLKDKHLPDKDIDSLETEKEQLRAAIDEHQKNLKSLRHENRKSMGMSVALFVILACGYAMFVM